MFSRGFFWLRESSSDADFSDCDAGDQTRVGFFLVRESSPWCGFLRLPRPGPDSRQRKPLLFVEDYNRSCHPPEAFVPPFFKPNPLHRKDNRVVRFVTLISLISLTFDTSRNQQK